MLKIVSSIIHFRSVRSISKSIVRLSTVDSSTNDDNKWLWDYLRHRQSFQALNDAQKRQIIVLELETLRESGERVPDRIPDDHWPEILATPLLNGRKSIYNYLFVREATKRKRSAEKEEVQKRRLSAVTRRIELAAAGLPVSNYPGYKTIFRQVNESQMGRWFRDTKLINEASLSEHVLVDCGFEISHARSKSVSRIVDQIEYFFCNIELFHSPSFVTLCNMSVDGEIRQEFQRRFHQNRAMTCFEMTEKSYLDLFDRKKLIYLSPNSPFEMTEFDHNAVYVIGAIIDSTGRGLSLAKAKRDNIKHQRFPFERYLKFGSSAPRSMSLDKIYNMLMTLKHGGTWADAFRVIPSRSQNRRAIRRAASIFVEKMKVFRFLLFRQIFNATTKLTFHHVEKRLSKNGRSNV